ncbi:MAG: hypothetical protein AB7E09_04455 [Candidatus Izemoplasmatales bacterium]
MKSLIESYNQEYKSYKNKLYEKLFYVFALFVIPLIPTIIYYKEILFVKVLFWIFASIIFIIILLFLALLLYRSERPMYEYLYKKIIDLAFEDDPTHHEYECFPKTYPFIEKGHLFKKAHSEVVRYRLTYYYLNNRIDLYSFYAYSKLHKSNEIVFNGIYYVLNNDNTQTFQVRTKGRNPFENKELKLMESSDAYDIYLKENDHIPNKIIDVFKSLTTRFDHPIYMSGAHKEIHVAIDKLYDKLAVKELTEDKLTELKDQIKILIQLGRDIYKKL